MFKVNVKKLNKNELLKKLDITESDKYTYVITDDGNSIESDKINIVFSESNVEDVKKIVKQIILGQEYYINAENLKGIKHINVADIEYFEARENDVYAVLGKERYYVIEKLYVLEGNLVQKNYVRVSKSNLVNITHIDYIKPFFNSKIMLFMTNGDKIEVNRTYTKSFRERIK